MYSQIAANKRNTVLILAGFVGFIGFIGALFAAVYGDSSIFILTLISAIIYASIMVFLSSSMAMVMTGAHPIAKKDYRSLYNIVENLTIATGLPMPEIYVIDDPAPNAFATGLDPAHAKVAVTTGLLNIMDKDELTGVLAHEISHIKNYDIRVSLVAFALVSVVGYIADIGLRMISYTNRRDEQDSPVGVIALLFTSILAPLVATIAQMAISREREYLADMSAAEITHYPDGLISALKKLDEHGQPMRRQNTATEAMFINNPLKKRRTNSLFRTHPPIEKRIERLERAKDNI